MAIVVLEYVLIVLFSYFVGNISWARFFSKKQNSDITKSGSGNPGTMNMLRTYGVKLAFATLILDVLKGVVPSLAGFLLFKFTGLNQDIGLYVAGLSAVVGHMWPVVYKFKGGKGVATTLGVFMVANPLWLLVAFGAGFLYVWFFDYGSVASLFIVAFMSIIQGYNNGVNYAGDQTTLLTVNILIFAIFVLVWFAHRANIVRLLIGKENKANLQKSFKKKFKTQKREEAKTEFIEQKSELKQEFKKLKAEYRQDVKERKKELKMQYREIKNTLKQTNSDILTTELQSEREELQSDVECQNVDAEHETNEKDSQNV